MTLHSIIERARSFGVTLWVEGDRLRFSPASNVSPDLLAEFRANKLELLTALAGPAPTQRQPDFDAFEERAAILGVDAGLSWTEAETAAALEQSYGSADDLHRAVLTGWRHQVESAVLIDDERGGPLVAASIAFLTNPFALEALRCGWTEAELWSAASGPRPWGRQDHGLVVAMAWSVFRHPLTAIYATAAQFQHLKFHRFKAEGRLPWWHHPAICTHPVDQRGGA